MGELITKTEFARRRNVTAAWVSVNIRRGNLTPPAVLDDGRIDYELALQQLRERLDPLRSTTSLDDDEDRSFEPTLAERLRRQRVEENDIRLRRLRQEDLERRGLYLRADEAQKAWVQAARSFIAAVELWLLRDLRDKLRLDKAALITLRAEWRALRQREAARLGAEAAASPEFVPDEGEKPG